MNLAWFENEELREIALELFATARQRDGARMVWRVRLSSGRIFPLPTEITKSRCAVLGVIDEAAYWPSENKTQESK